SDVHPMCSDTSATSPAAAMSSQTRSPHPSIPGRDRRSTAAATAVTNASGTWVMVAYLLYSLFRHSSPPALPVPAPHRVEVVAVVGHGPGLVPGQCLPHITREGKPGSRPVHVVHAGGVD